MWKQMMNSKRKKVTSRKISKNRINKSKKKMRAKEIILRQVKKYKLLVIGLIL